MEMIPGSEPLKVSDQFKMEMVQQELTALAKKYDIKVAVVGALMLGDNSNTLQVYYSICSRSVPEHLHERITDMRRKLTGQLDGWFNDLMRERGLA